MSSHDIIVFGKVGVCVFCGVFAALPWFVVAHAVFREKFLDRHVAYQKREKKCEMLDLGHFGFTQFIFKFCGSEM